MRCSRFFIWEPLAQALRLSLYETKGMQLIQFVGLSNYRSVLVQPDFWPAVRNTFLYMLWSLVIGYLTPIILAIFIHESVRGKSLYRTAVYLPNIVPGLATVFLWRYVFKSDDYGAMNMLLSLLGIPAQDYLNNAVRVIPMIVITMTWKSAGATALLYLAGLQGINPELYEAAVIDGANVKQRIFHVTIPQLLQPGAHPVDFADHRGVPDPLRTAGDDQRRPEQRLRIPDAVGVPLCV